MDKVTDLLIRIAELEAEYKALSKLHERATERTVQLAAVIERARTAPPVETFDGGIRQDTVYTILETVDTRAVLAEHDREVAEKAWDEGAYHSAGDACMSVRHGDPCPQNPYRTGWWESRYMVTMDTSRNEDNDD